MDTDTKGIAAMMGLLQIEIPGEGDTGLYIAVALVLFIMLLGKFIDRLLPMRVQNDTAIAIEIRDAIKEGNTTISKQLYNLQSSSDELIDLHKKTDDEGRPVWYCKYKKE